MYNAKYFLVANLLNPYAVSSRNKLKTKAESSANHYLQNENPGKDEEFNWLPAPAGQAHSLAPWKPGLGTKGYKILTKVIRNR